jgi:hypothetical protein
VRERDWIAHMDIKEEKRNQDENMIEIRQVDNSREIIG